MGGACGEAVSGTKERVLVRSTLGWGEAMDGSKGVVCLVVDAEQELMLKLELNLEKYSGDR